MVRFMSSGKGREQARAHPAHLGKPKQYRPLFGFRSGAVCAAGSTFRYGSASGLVLTRRSAAGSVLTRSPTSGLVHICRSAAGFTYIGLLMMIAISGIGLAALGQAWHTASQRDKEQELIFVGLQISHAISHYYEFTPSPIKQYPPTLAALLDDRRGPKPVRHLRKIYIDPMTASRDWGLIKSASGITGVYSQSKLRPFKQEDFSEDLQGFSGAGSYRDWQFVASDKGSTVTPSNPRHPLNEPNLPDTSAPTAPTPAPSAGAGGAANPEKYARCGSSLDAAQLSCHSGCGLASSPACRSCLQAAFDGYRQCLR